MNSKLSRTWLAALTGIVAVLYAGTGFAAQGIDRAAGLLGGVMILTSLAVALRFRRAAMTLLVVGCVPLAVLTWWSIVTPVLAVLCLALGWPRTGATRSRDPRPDVRLSETESVRSG